MGVVMATKHGFGITIDGVDYETLDIYGKKHGIDIARLRRACRTGTIKTAMQPLGDRWIVPVDMVPPALGERGTRSTHPNHVRYFVHVPLVVDPTDETNRIPDATVLTAIRNMNCIVTDPRVLARKRRTKKQRAEHERLIGIWNGFDDATRDALISGTDAEHDAVMVRVAVAMGFDNPNDVDTFIDTLGDGEME
jgi:hypothetical protein